MAIINCKECGQEVSSNADKCPKCGNPINNTSNEGCFLQTLNMGCMFLALLIGLFLLLVLVSLFSS